jgi:hypothetical protein
MTPALTLGRSVSMSQEETDVCYAVPAGAFVIELATQSSRPAGRSRRAELERKRGPRALVGFGARSAPGDWQ